MRFLVDENFPYSAVEHLRRLGHDVVAVRDVMRGAPDEGILARSRAENRVLITADKGEPAGAALRAARTAANVRPAQCTLLSRK